MFGPGVYLAESCLKSDEYTTPNREGLLPLILCRVVLGRVHECLESNPWPIGQKLCDSCLSGRYQSVLGDREKVMGTFREFIVYDSHQVYPEYVVWYERMPPFLNQKA